MIEPYDNNPPQINLYNPSIVKSRITLHDLKPATKYSCVLVGAISLDVGREKLAILSDAITFSTLLGKLASVQYHMEFILNASILQKLEGEEVVQNLE